MNLRYFNLSEFDCKHTGENMMNKDFLLKLDELRHLCGFPFIINSGYRHPSHPIEAKKAVPGTHAQGIASDIRAITGNQKYILIREAYNLEFTGIGIAETFVHLDIRKTVPTIWLY